MAETPLYLYKRRKLELKNDNSIEDSSKNDIEDRLTSLPDTLLVEILSLLPIKSAAATSVLSQRWRHLWTQLPHLFFDGDDPPWNLSRRASNTVEKTVIRFETLLNHILNQLTSPHIQTFNLCIPNPDYSIKCKKFQSTLKSTFRFLGIRNVAAIKVRSITRSVYVPTCIFKLPSLVQLHLGGYLCCKLPKTKKGIGGLPNLKKLELGDVYLDNLQKLWALINNSCPILEYLSLKLPSYNDGVVNISSPMLKSLFIYEISPQGVKFVIDTPLLENLAVVGHLGYYRFVKYPTKLIKAEICIPNYPPILQNTDLFRQKIPLVQRISGVESLSLGYSKHFFRDLRYFDIDFSSIFDNLTHLRLTPAVDFDVYSPIPSYVFRKLKRLEIMKMMGNAKDVKFLNYIISNAIVLERLYVTTVHDDDDFGYTYSDSDDDEDDDNKYIQREKLWWEYKICKYLLALPRSSLPSEIEFVGGYTRVASNSYQNALILTCMDQYPASRLRSFW